jgi:N-acetylglutamate synthase/N-acetylornithine aminotransferase
VKRRITVFTRETFERAVACGGSPATDARAWCEGCAADVGMISPEEAALLARVSTRAIYRWAEAGSIHYAETSDGFLTVCRQALSERLAALPRQLTSGEK